MLSSLLHRFEIEVSVQRGRGDRQAKSYGLVEANMAVPCSIMISHDPICTPQYPVSIEALLSWRIYNQNNTVITIGMYSIFESRDFIENDEDEFRLVHAHCM